MKTYTKIISITVLLLSSIFILLTCGGGSNPAIGAVAGSEKIVNPAGEFPIVKEPIDMSLMMVAAEQLTDFDTNGMTMMLEEKTGINLSATMLPLEAKQEKFNLAVASGELPDVLMGVRLNPIQLAELARSGTIIPLDPYIEKYGVEYKRMTKEIPWLDKALRIDGKIYDLPDYNEAYHTTMIHKAWVYKPWLEKLGIEAPKTTEEFEKMLIAFRDQDPNGNGKKDEIPMSGANTSWANSKVEDYIMNAFIYTEDDRIMLKKGKLSFVADTPEWREGLRYIKKLYDEKLFNDTTFTQGYEQVAQLGRAEPHVLGVGISGYNLFGEFNDPTKIGPENIAGNESDWIVLEPLEGPNGVKVTPWQPFTVQRGAFMITSNAKYPEAAYRLGDLFLSQTMSLSIMLGPEGYAWEYIPQGIKSEAILGGDALYRLIDKEEYLERHPGTTEDEYNLLGKNNAWIQQSPSFRPFKSLRARLEKTIWPFHYFYETETKRAYEPYQPKIEDVLPPLSYSSEESEQLLDIEKALLDFVNESTTKFIRGDLDLDKDWQSYVDTLKELGRDDYISLNQSAYERSKLY